MWAHFKSHGQLGRIFATAWPHKQLTSQSCHTRQPVTSASLNWMQTWWRPLAEGQSQRQECFGRRGRALVVTENSANKNQLVIWLIDWLKWLWSLKAADVSQTAADLQGFAPHHNHLVWVYRPGNNNLLSRLVFINHCAVAHLCTMTQYQVWT